MEDFAAFDEFPTEPQAPSQTAQPKAQYYIDEEEVSAEDVASFRICLLHQRPSRPIEAEEDTHTWEHSHPSPRPRQSQFDGVSSLQALGFHIWVAELELLLGQVKGSKANIEPVAALELLQVLVSLCSMCR